MPVSSQQSTFNDRGFLWATWTGDSDTPGSTLGPVQAPQIRVRLAQRRTVVSDHARSARRTLPALLTGPPGRGAGKIGMTTQQWLQVAN